jgi:hypothetical protein
VFPNQRGGVRHGRGPTMLMRTIRSYKMNGRIIR